MRGWQAPRGRESHRSHSGCGTQISKTWRRWSTQNWGLRYAAAGNTEFSIGSGRAILFLPAPAKWQGGWRRCAQACAHARMCGCPQQEHGLEEKEKEEKKEEVGGSTGSVSKERKQSGGGKRAAGPQPLAGSVNRPCGGGPRPCGAHASVHRCGEHCRTRLEPAGVLAERGGVGARGRGGGEGKPPPRPLGPDPRSGRVEYTSVRGVIPRAFSSEFAARRSARRTSNHVPKGSRAVRWSSQWLALEAPEASAARADTVCPVALTHVPLEWLSCRAGAARDGSGGAECAFLCEGTRAGGEEETQRGDEPSQRCPAPRVASSSKWQMHFVQFKIVQVSCT